jgi:hypothetical protein
MRVLYWVSGGHCIERLAAGTNLLLPVESCRSSLLERESIDPGLYL